VDDGILIRSASLDSVQFSERVIDMIVVPYGVETEVRLQGRKVFEVFERGAFDKISAARRRFAVNRGHDVDRIVGKAIRFDPDDDVGLAASVKIAATPLGDETLQLASEGLLDASVGYVPKQVVWQRGRTVMRVAKAWLDHISLVPDPAYADARVLAVRAQDVTLEPAASDVAVPTPLLDEVRSWKLHERFASIGLE
jgi:HK97 family phage prohead protease